MKSSKILCILCIAAGFARLSPVHADTWDGGAPDTNWMSSNNWNPNAAPIAGDSLTFPSGALKLTNVNNFPALTAFQSITFTGANYNLGGNSIQLTGGILSGQAVGTNSVNLDVQLAQNQIFTAQNNGAFLVVSGDVDLNGFDLTLSGTGNPFLSGVISGSGALIKNGNGFSRLTGNNTYSGGTTVNGGTLEVGNTTGSGTGSGPVVVESGAELQGDGVIGGELLVKTGGKVSPGDDEPAVLAVGDLILDPDSAIVIQVNGPIPDTEYSQLDVTGTVTLDQSNFRMALGPNVGAGDDFKIIDNDATDDVVGFFEGLEEGDTFRLVGNDDVGFKITYRGGDGNDVVISSIPTASISDVEVNEPASGTTTANFVVTLTEESDDPVTIQFSTAPGTATAPGDYSSRSGTITFAPGDTSEVIEITVKSDDEEENDETYSVTLFSPTNASIADDEGIATIADAGTVNPNPNPNPNPTNPGGGGSASGDGGCGLNARTTETNWLSLAVLVPLGFLFALRMRRRLHD